MSVTYIVANDEAAKSITALRRMVWETTYRGIYADELIDKYDYEGYEQRDLLRLRDPSYHVYLIKDADTPIGYLMFSDTGVVHIQALYILQSYQQRGIGKRAFALIRRYCREHGFGEFTCNCNAHNLPAQGFYRAMGGVEIKRDEGHDDKRDDQITFSFRVDDRN